PHVDYRGVVRACFETAKARDVVRQHAADVAPVRAAAEEIELVVTGEGVDDRGLIDGHRIVRRCLPGADVRNAEYHREKRARRFFGGRIGVREEDAVARERIEFRASTETIAERTALEGGKRFELNQDDV